MSEATGTPVGPHAGRPLVIGHRGAAGHRPEHTLASYELAARLGADCLEPDVVTTGDGVLVCRHENEISGTTDVARRPEFASRRTTKVVSGVTVTGWFTEDFTLAELRTLRAAERLPGLRPANSHHDGLHQVPTLAEVLLLRERLAAELNRPIGIYPETKHPSYFASVGLALEEPLVADLAAAGLLDQSAPRPAASVPPGYEVPAGEPGYDVAAGGQPADGPPSGGPAAAVQVFVQSFELGNLRRLREELGVQVPLVLLTELGGAPWDLRAAGDPRTSADLLTAAGLAELARFVDGIGPEKRQVIPWRSDGRLDRPTTLVRDAHAAGLLVHPWTFRAENAFLPLDFRIGGLPGAHGDLAGEIAAHLDAGVDGFFTDHPGWPGERSGPEWTTTEWATTEWTTTEWTTTEWSTSEWSTSEWSTSEWTTGEWTTGEWTTGEWTTGEAEG